MSWENAVTGSCAMQSMVTVSHEHTSGETAPVADTVSGAGAESAPTDAKPVVTLAHVTPRPGRVLVVDDDEVIRRLIAANLTLEGFDVATAVDGQDCLDKVSAIAPEVITLDVTMPRLDGWETAVQLRNTPDTSRVKIVLIIARSELDDPARRTNAGADAYLTKPFDAGELIRVVRKLAGAPPAAFAREAPAT
jgi:CheY-like chemotaxis protein